ncbi:hypothetical protein HDU93_003461 [Gonapodya sp. JEL0774]|nr:hypothetical protein HDU93_003461 [Gonapodya sp. JEL0774]
MPPVDWSIDRANQHYNVEGWANGYFSIRGAVVPGNGAPTAHSSPSTSPTSAAAVGQSALDALSGQQTTQQTPSATSKAVDGTMQVHPLGPNGPTFNIMDVIDDIKEKGLQFPIVRFLDILRARVILLNEAFSTAISSLNYAGSYRGVYPVKVNQMKEVVDEIVDAGRPFHYGLEAGSKGELTVVLGYNTDPEAITCCNGYKDDDYLRLALLGRKLGRKVIVIIEKLTELPHLLQLASEMGVEPYLGLRCKLASRGSGKWESSGGDFAKFGLTLPELMRAVAMLKERGMENCAKLIHFHVGSQLTELRVVKEAVMEGARIYAKLQKMGLGIEYFDIGGGLGVDYIGTRSGADGSSMNYDVHEYAYDVVYTLMRICVEEGVPQPNVVSESGRAITAHHALVIVNIFGTISVGSPEEIAAVTTPTPGEHVIVQEMRNIVGSYTSRSKTVKSWQDAQSKKEDALQMFKLGMLSLEDRAKVEGLYWAVARKMMPYTKTRSRKLRIPKEAMDIADKMADQYMANFSIFQSVVDHWGIDQTFPITPLHRLNEEPCRDSILVDITCDSDGKIDNFVEDYGTDKTISLHTLRPGEDYYIGIFLTGAYQDIMGNYDDDPEDYYIEEVIRGDRVADVLGRLFYNPQDLTRRVKESLTTCIRSGSLKPKEGVALGEFYDSMINSYTYLKGMSPH